MSTTLSYRDRVKKLEQRRLKAGRMFEAGKTQAEVARCVQVSCAAVCQWHAAWSKDKKHGLHAKGLSGPEPKLTAKAKQILKRAIITGPVRAGYTTDFWTIDRIRAVARKRCKVTLSPTTIWRTVISLGFSVQKPERRARERNEQAISDWKLKTFPKLKKMGTNT